MAQNGGKANAVFTGFRQLLKHKNFKKVAYLDADLATSLEECLRLSEQVKEKVVLAFGSRILKLTTKSKENGTVLYWKSGRYCHLQCIEFKHIRFSMRLQNF